MPIGTPLKTPPSLRDTSSINRGGLKSFCSSFILIAKPCYMGGSPRPYGAGAHTSLSYRPYGRYLNTILEIIGYFNLLRPSAMPIGTPLKTPPSLRDTSSINRGGLKVLLFKFYLNSKRRVIWAGSPTYGANTHPCHIDRTGDISTRF